MTTAETRPSPSKASSSSPPWKVDALRLEQLLEPAAGVGAEGPRQRHVLHHHDRAPGPLRGQRGGDLGADVAAADQDDVLGRLGVGADRVGVAEGAQVVDALVLGALDPEDVDHRPGGDQRLAEGDLLPALDLGGARLGVERHHVAPAQQLDAVLLIPGGRVDVGVLARWPRRAGTPWRAAAVRRAAPARGRPAGPSPRPPLAQLGRAVGGGHAAADQQEVDLAVRPFGTAGCCATAAAAGRAP